MTFRASKLEPWQLEAARRLTSDDRSGAYTKAYRRHCENKTGDDITAATKWYVL